MSIHDDESITGREGLGASADEQSIVAGGVTRGRVGPADGGEHEPGATDGEPEVRSVEESRAEAAGDQDDAAETETDEDRTQGYA